MVQSGSKSIELAVLRSGQPLQVRVSDSARASLPWQLLPSDDIEAITKEIDAEKEAEAERKKAEKRAAGGAAEPAPSST